MINRRLNLSKEFIDKMKKYKIDTTPPAPDSLFWKLWNANEAIAEKAFETEFIKQIANGKLSPDSYGGFTVSDAFYCFEGAQDYLNAECRAENSIIRSFLSLKYKSYMEYNKYFTDTFRIRDANGVVPYGVTKQYALFEKNIASHQDPIYLIITMIPCEFLWYWLAKKIKEKETSNNIYKFWIDGNDSAAGAYMMGKVIEFFRKEIDEEKAMCFYNKAMNYEYENFKNAVSSL